MYRQLHIVKTTASIPTICFYAVIVPWTGGHLSIVSSLWLVASCYTASWSVVSWLSSSCSIEQRLSVCCICLLPRWLFCHVHTVILDKCAVLLKTLSRREYSVQFQLCADREINFIRLTCIYKRIRINCVVWRRSRPSTAGIVITLWFVLSASSQLSNGCYVPVTRATDASVVVAPSLTDHTHRK